MKIALLIVVWLSSVAGGMGLLLQYKQTPGKVAEAPSVWPEGSVVKLHPERATLVMLLHPRCPCSRASVEELAKLLTRAGGSLDAHAIVVLPKEHNEDWEKSDLAVRASELSGLRVHMDPGGTEARKFGAFTSGQTELYTPLGQLLFSGGITPSRGHMGDNRGASEIERLALMPGQRRADEKLETSKVFGCDLNDPEGAKL